MAMVGGESRTWNVIAHPISYSASLNPISSHTVLYRTSHDGRKETEGFQIVSNRVVFSSLASWSQSSGHLPSAGQCLRAVPRLESWEGDVECVCECHVLRAEGSTNGTWGASFGRQDYWPTTIRSRAAAGRTPSISCMIPTNSALLEAQVLI
ncbi:hypothetical protein BGZ63DRAFT_391318, partial [Mariannaea sp. PMI_226]